MTKKIKLLVSLITLSSAFCLSGCANKTPYIGDNGNWWMDGSDLGIPATGPKGDTGAQGSTGEKGDQGSKGDKGDSGKDGITYYANTILPLEHGYIYQDSGSYKVGTEMSITVVPNKNYYVKSLKLINKGQETIIDSINMTPNESETFKVNQVEGGYVISAEILRSSTVIFGEYPQDVVIDETIKSALASLPNGTIEGTVLDYDSDNDGINERYLVSNAKYAFKSDDGTSIPAGINYFKYQPIEWFELWFDENSSTIITSKIIDAKKYDLNYKNNYKNSNLRSFLNGDFLTKTFTAEEYNSILTTEIDNSIVSTGENPNDYACEDTSDKVFALSAKEFSIYFASDNDRIAITTDYVRSLDPSWIIGDGNRGELNAMGWWLRSPNNENEMYVKVTSYDGDLDSWCSANNLGGVRPALRIEL